MHFNYQLGLGSATLLQLAFLGEKRPAFPMGEIPIGTTKCTQYKIYVFGASTVFSAAEI